jgi:hypothetical protein
MDWRLISIREEETILEQPDGTPVSLAPDKAAGCHRCRVGIVGMFKNSMPQLKSLKKNEDRIASENSFYRLRISLVASSALSRQEFIAGRRAVA